MTSTIRSLSVRARFSLTVVAGVAASLMLAGCGLGDAPTSSSPAVAASFSGKLHGGPNPIQGAVVKLFTTGSNGSNGGYGVGSFVQEANAGNSPEGGDSNVDGSFTFAGGYSCPAGQFLYIVSSGGDTGNGVNPKAFLVSALGRCEASPPSQVTAPAVMALSPPSVSAHRRQTMLR